MLAAGIISSQILNHLHFQVSLIVGSKINLKWISTSISFKFPFSTWSSPYETLTFSSGYSESLVVRFQFLRWDITSSGASHAQPAGIFNHHLMTLLQWTLPLGTQPLLLRISLWLFLHLFLDLDYSHTTPCYYLCLSCWFVTTLVYHNYTFHKMILLNQVLKDQLRPVLKPISTGFNWLLVRPV